jgi:ferrous iron transport protein A
MADALKLSRLALGASGRIKELPRAGTSFLRLREMGLLPGTTVTLVRAAPLGDPIEIKVRGYHLSLRLEEAEQITLEA